MYSPATIVMAQAAEAVSEISIEGLISDLAFILILGAAVTLLFKFIKQPVVLGYIVAGFLASPNFEPLPSVANEANIEFSGPTRNRVPAVFARTGIQFQETCQRRRVGSSDGPDHRGRDDGDRICDRHTYGAVDDQQPVSRRHVVDVVDHNNHQGVYRHGA